MKTMTGDRAGNGGGAAGAAHPPGVPFTRADWALVMLAPAIFSLAPLIAKYTKAAPAQAGVRVAVFLVALGLIAWMTRRFHRDREGKRSARVVLMWAALSMIVLSVGAAEGVLDIFGVNL